MRVITGRGWKGTGTGANRGLKRTGTGGGGDYLKGECRKEDGIYFAISYSPSLVGLPQP